MCICFNIQNCAVVVSVFKSGDNFIFDLEADYSADGDVEGKWVGVALGLDGGRGMGNDAAVACFADADGIAHTDNYWNVLDPAFFSFPVEVSSIFFKLKNLFSLLHKKSFT